MSEPKRILVTCPPMLRMMPQLQALFKGRNVQLTTPEVVQILSVEQLKEIVPQHDGWIIGDDPATREVFVAGKAGRLRAAVKWGVGVDNVDFAACKDLEIPIVNTPGMFGQEVADVGVGYVIALARETFAIDHGVRNGEWPKPRGISLAGRKCAVLGMGDIGRNVAKRLAACGMEIIGYDPVATQDSVPAGVKLQTWPKELGEADFLVVTCALTPSSLHMVNAASLAQMKPGVRVVNVARGPIIDEAALVAALRSGHVHSAAVDVFEVEPLPVDSQLREFGWRCLFGSHNGSNTADAVLRTSQIAVQKLYGFLGVQ
ncbi:phosphoglycerate dehydrogenase [Ramlibacter sp. XY19]|uniref:phosphoglycerate dehydrogenase n=1 Tax=Ramlibacter paludis TaxID=2908000 RepID=UPI0023DA1EEF|nr:phosphoglycerate dehydrogenase [Ramlibacter paludis]MCG2592020.1 phosphoglycerate dehydrogenase [Ramlibacter paludis]